LKQPKNILENSGENETKKGQRENKIFYFDIPDTLKGKD